MSRLAASRKEVEESAHEWGKEATVLEGANARRDLFLEELSHGPWDTIHLATHVLSSNTQLDHVFLAFSLDSDGQPELMPVEEVAMLQVPGSMVVMTGCASGTGEVRGGPGLQGLTSAWLLAGAGTVVSTRWPIPDSEGDLLPLFYRNLKHTRAAEALQRSQVETIHSGTWRAAPAYWAAFQITGGSR